MSLSRHNETLMRSLLHAVSASRKTKRSLSAPRHLYMLGYDSSLLAFSLSIPNLLSDVGITVVVRISNIREIMILGVGMIFLKSYANKGFLHLCPTGRRGRGRK
jgi:hypothetical protein